MQRPMPKELKLRIGVGWAVLMLVLSLAGVGISNLVYTNRTVQESNWRWCSLLTALDQPSVPASSPMDQLIRKLIHDLRADLNCPEGSAPQPPP